MPLEILILEDDANRRAVMSDCLMDRFRHYAVRYFESAGPMIEYLESNLTRVIAISLDHDLEFPAAESGTAVDPGSGRDVADFLARQSPTCPVIIASTNSPAVIGMEIVLQEAQWTTFRVVPYNDVEWISAVWIQTVRRAIVDSAAEPSRTS